MSKVLAAVDGSTYAEAFEYVSYLTKNVDLD
jgi:hypothetical protein